jgi:hypothetical protein
MKRGAFTMILTPFVAVMIVASASGARAAFSGGVVATTRVTTESVVPPTDLVATIACTPWTSVSVRLSWSTPQAIRNAEVEVLRANKNGAAVVIGTVAEPTSEFVDTSARFSRTYSYSLRVKVSLWQSVTSAPVTRTMPNIACKPK